MAYGTSAYGASGYGGNANAVDEQMFFPLLGASLAPDILHERSALFTGSSQRYQILTRQGSENPSGPNGAEYKVYVSHSEGETPQLQVTVQGVGQTIVSAGRLIVVTAIVDGSIWPTGLNFSVVGRPYTQ